MTAEHQKILDEYAIFQGWQLRQGVTTPDEVRERIEEMQYQLESSEVQ